MFCSKARPAVNSGFLPIPERLTEMRQRAPFNRAWVNPTIEEYKLKNKYLYIAPVNMEFLEKTFYKKYEGLKLISRLEDVLELSNYMHATFKMAIENYPKKFVEVVDVPGKDTFQLELALVDISPTKPAITTFGSILGLVVPGAGIIARFGSGSVAMEGIVRDYESGEVLAEFADREADKTAPFTVKDYQEFANVRASISDWAEQYAELSATEMNHRVEDSLPFTLNPL